MKKIDRYILKKFLSTFFFCILLLTVIVVVIDISEKTDDFVNSKLSAWRIFTDYYAAFIPRIDAMLFPLFTFIAVIFFTSKMAERTEVVAILSSGVSIRRFLRAYWVGSVLLALILWVTYHTVLPTANAKWSSFESKYVAGNLDYTKSYTGRNFYFRLDSHSYAGLRYFDTVSRTGSGFFVQKILNNRLVYNLRSDNISWDTTSKKWKLTGVTERNFDGDKEMIKRSTSLLMQYNFRPRDLRRDDFLKDRMGTKELDEYIAIQQLRGAESLSELMVERYNRDAIPASIIILTIIGAVLSSKKVRGGSGFHLAVGVILSVIYVLFSRLSVVFATKGNFPPLLAAWVPNIAFGLLAYYFYRRAAR
ncbi:MAG TPA: LptF/LptG family permease [Ferruginibacter sp.]|nr:LptF/LptG family permease [Ferruginibacter sp.]